MANASALQPVLIEPVTRMDHQDLLKAYGELAAENWRNLEAYRCVEELAAEAIMAKVAAESSNRVLTLRVLQYRDHLLDAHIVAGAAIIAVVLLTAKQLGWI